MIQLWKKVKGYDGRYEVSNDGKVRSIAKWIKSSNGRNRFYPGKLLSKITRNGYLAVWLCRDGEAKNTSIHRVVAGAFVPNTENKPHVNHINGIKADNRSVNLEWCTAKENSQHAMKMGLVIGLKGVMNGSNKLSESQVKEIYKMKFTSNESQEKIAKKFHVHQSVISYIWSKKQWSHVTNTI